MSICAECGKELGVYETIWRLPFVNINLAAEPEDTIHGGLDGFYNVYKFCLPCSLKVKKEFKNKTYVPKFKEGQNGDNKIR